MKTTAFVCPNCGAVLNTSYSKSKLICEYCGSAISISFTTKNNEKEIDGNSLIQSLIERKFIYYIPHLDGISDCYDFILDYAEAMFVYNKKKELLSKDELVLVKAFFEDGFKYINDCVQKNYDAMVYSQLYKYEYAFDVMAEEKNEFVDFNELKTMMTNKIISDRSSNRKHRYKSNQKGMWIVVLIIIFVVAIIVVPGIISLIFALL